MAVFAPASMPSRFRIQIKCAPCSLTGRMAASIEGCARAGRCDGRGDALALGVVRGMTRMMGCSVAGPISPQGKLSQVLKQSTGEG